MNLPPITRVWFLVTAALGCTPLLAAEDWFDTYYQYRIPIVVEASTSGWNAIVLNEQQITTAINQLEELQFDPQYFAYNYATMVEVDPQGKFISSDLEAGFYLVEQGKNLAAGALAGGQDTVEVPVDKLAPYLLRYRSAGGSKDPMFRYENIFHPSSTMRKHNYQVSFMAPMLPKALTTHERLFIPDHSPAQLDVGGRWVSGLEEIELHRAQIRLLAKLPRAGRTHLMLYYQPMCGHHLMVPKKRRTQLPDSRARVSRMGPAQKYEIGVRHRLSSDRNDLDLWFAQTTVKLTPQTPLPRRAADAITIRSAKNEAQSFQLVLRPKTALDLKSIRVTDLTHGSATIAGDQITVNQIAYVPIVESSYITPARYQGMMGDPLVELTPQPLVPEDGNTAIWVTVRTPASAPSGTYQGQVLIAMDQGQVKVPLRLEVYDFELPEYSTLHSMVGGNYIGHGNELNDDPSMLDYHGLKKEDLKKLARSYFTVMAHNKFMPKNVAIYNEVGMNWTAPPDGYNVDTPGNYFKLHDWDFTEFNETLAYFIDELKVNTITLEHTNPSVCNIFKHLPGERLDELAKSTPHITMGWQTFRERTFVAYGKRKGDAFSDETIEITRDQYDRLLLDYFRAMAANLEVHGWLDKSFIMLDETMDQGRLLHYLQLLKSDPLIARLKVGACIQGFESFEYKVNPDDKEYAFNGLYDYYIPQMDENYNRWEKYLFTDHNLELDRRKIWNYAVSTSRLIIDTPGVNNRVLGLDLFQRGASGFLVWDTIYWGTGHRRDINPWRNPICNWGNGAIYYFYPPNRNGLAAKPDWTITPALRVETYREAVDDYEYARILEDLVAAGRHQGVDTRAAEQIFTDIERFFHNSVHWSQNDAWLLDLRHRMAQAIMELKRQSHKLSRAARVDRN